MNQCISERETGTQCAAGGGSVQQRCRRCYRKLELIRILSLPVTNFRTCISLAAQFTIMAARVPKTRLGRCCRYCGIAVSFLISQFGLCALVLAYAVGGAFMFSYLESPHEQLVSNDTRAKRQQFLSILWQLTALTENKTVLSYDDWIATAQSELVNFENEIIRAVKYDGYNGSEGEGEDLQWSVAGAMMYSIIVITTIGYGNLAPKTTVGRIVTMLYAIAGIPLLRLFLSEIGDFLADTFKFIYWKVCYRLCIKEKHRIRHQNRRQQTHRRYAGGPLVHSENVPIPMTPINQCSPVLSRSSSTASDQAKLPFSDYIDASRVPVISNKYALQSDSHEREISSVRDNFSRNFQCRGRPALPPLDLTRAQSSRHFTISPQPPQLAVFQDSANYWESESESSDNEENVPIIMCMCLVLGYICGGAWLFRQWEVDWSFLDSAYFCFVTLTTIGFGDMVPKAVLVPDTNEGRTTLIVCALYLLFGMALLAMSFNLVQEAVSKSIKSTVRKVRIISFLETSRRRDIPRRVRRHSLPNCQFLPMPSYESPVTRSPH